MVRAMVHEAGHRAGTYVDHKIGASTGWVCHEGSFSDCMPVWYEAGNICLAFSGEHFADKTDLERLRAAGHVFTEGTAESLVHLYERHGEKFFEMLNGFFSGILFDL